METQLHLRRAHRLAGAVLVVALVIFSGLTVFSAAPEAQAAGPTFIYTTFKGDAAADQELWVYTSPDSSTMNLLADTNFQGPSGAVRDPSIIKHADGLYYVAYTTASWSARTTSFNVAVSADLRNWSHVATVPAGVNGTAYTWAPEFYVEGSTVRIIVSLARTDWQFQPYVYTAQNPGLTSWSGPQPLGIPANHIDTYIAKSGSTYHAFVKNETTKYIEHWTTGSLFGGWTFHSTVFPARHEGPSLVRQTDGRWRIYVDRYPSSGMWTSTSDDLWTWSGLSRVACSGCRHGTVIYDSTYSADTQYRVTARHSGKVLDVQNPNTSNGAQIGQYAWNGGSWQRWQFQDVPGGFVRLVSRVSGRCAGVENNSTSDGARVLQWTCNPDTGQQWSIRDAGGGYWQLVNRNSGKCLDIDGVSVADGARALQWTCGSGTNQHFSRSAA